MTKRWLPLWAIACLACAEATDFEGTDDQDAGGQGEADGGGLDTGRPPAPDAAPIGCEGQPDGHPLGADPWAPCEGFGSPCDETGVRSRMVQVCRGGVEVREEETEACLRDTNGAACGAGGTCTSGACVEPEQVCEEDRFEENDAQDRAQALVADTYAGLQICAGDADWFSVALGVGDVVRATVRFSHAAGDLDLELFDPAGAPAAESRSADDDETVEHEAVTQGSHALRISGHGGEVSNAYDLELAVERAGGSPCMDRPDGAVVSEGNWGECTSEAGACALDGERTRSNVVCRDGAEALEEETEACQRETEGNPCEGGVCRGGVCEAIEGCGAEPDGTVVSVGEWSECGGFDDVCDEQGTRQRPRRVCRGGQEVDDPEVEVCARDTDGTECPIGICDDGACRAQESCEVEPDGTVVFTGEWSACGGFGDDCDEDGMQTRPIRVCRGGAEADDEESRACMRDTDGLELDADLWGDCEFPDRCAEDGEETRDVEICRGGRAVFEEQSRGCERDTDGDIVERDEWGACEGFVDPCDETGEEIREQQVCRNGRLDREEETRACRRDTDGDVVAFGDWGGCEQFSSDCDETGVESRENDVCRDGDVRDVEEERDCRRDTEGDACGERRACADGECTCLDQLTFALHGEDGDFGPVRDYFGDDRCQQRERQGVCVDNHRYEHAVYLGSYGDRHNDDGAGGIGEILGVFSPDTDEQWYYMEVRDQVGLQILDPRVELAWPGAAGDLDLTVEYHCNSTTESVDPSAGNCALQGQGAGAFIQCQSNGGDSNEAIQFQPGCDGADDGGILYIRVLRFAGHSCNPYRVTGHL